MDNLIIKKRVRTHRTSLLWACAVVLLFITVNAGISADPTSTDWYEGGILAAQKCDMQEVEKCIKSLEKFPDARVRIAAIQATFFEFTGKNKEALDILHECVGGIGGLNKQPNDIFFQYWRLLAKTEDPAKSIGILNGMLEKNASREHAIRCLCALADIDLYYQRYDSALARAKAAHTGAHPQKKYSDSQAIDDFLVMQVDALLSRISEVIEIMKHGAGYHLYAQGNRNFRAKEYQKAIAIYERLLQMHKNNKGKPIVAIVSPEDPRFNELPIFDVYAEASMVYCSESYYYVGSYGNAEKLISPILSKRGGPYYGEALVALAQISMCTRGPSKQTVEHLTNAINWVEKESRKETDYSQYNIPEASKDLTKPATVMRYVDEWSNLKWFNFKPEQVYNPNTCPWYKDYIHYRALSLRSLIYFMLDDQPKAIADLSELSKLDPLDDKLTQSGMPSNFSRLRDDYKAKRLFATASELELFQGEMLGKLALGELLLELELLDDADRMYALIQSTYKDKLNKNQNAYLNFARASCHAYLGDSKKALEFLRPFTSLWKDTPSTPRALVLWADYQNDATSKIIVLDAAMKSASGTAMVREIAFRKGQVLYADGFYSDATQIFTELLDSSKDANFALSCRNYLKQIQADINRKKP